MSTDIDVMKLTIFIITLFCCIRLLIWWWIAYASYERYSARARCSFRTIAEQCKWYSGAFDIIHRNAMCSVHASMPAIGKSTAMNMINTSFCSIWDAWETTCFIWYGNNRRRCILVVLPTTNQQTVWNGECNSLRLCHTVNTSDRFNCWQCVKPYEKSIRVRSVLAHVVYVLGICIGIWWNSYMPKIQASYYRIRSQKNISIE